MTGIFDRQAIRRAAAILEVADRYPGNEIDDALAAARRAIVYSFEEAGADVDTERALREALDVAIAILHNRRVSPPTSAFSICSDGFARDFGRSARDLLTANRSRQFILLRKRERPEPEAGRRARPHAFALGFTRRSRCGFGASVRQSAPERGGTPGCVAWRALESPREPGKGVASPRSLALP
jgi:hypothetical protein